MAALERAHAAYPLPAARAALMCGIAGFFGLRAHGEEARAVATAMCELIRHRGPDGGGVTVHDDVALGMVRLAIVDVEHGAQPMYSDDGAIALVYNGEVYNAPALRRQLEAEGVRFKTRSDTEVILRLYEKNPERVEEHLVGMWAFAVHDRRRHRVSLSRDRFGIKPLFIADAGDALAFASELRCFAPARPLGIERLFGIDHGAAHAMLAWAYVPNEESIYEGVKRLPPATRLDIDLRTGERRMRRYWDLRPDATASQVRTLDEACELIDPLLLRAVTEHLESDVPVAAFLSGGIDSSLVLAHAMHASSAPVHAFTIGFREERFDESPFARQVALGVSAPIHVEMLDEDAVRASLPEALAAYDEPFGDSSSLATYLLSKVVARTHKVALGGDGGDEIFAGYKKHRIIAVRDLVNRAPRLRELAAHALMALPSRTDRTTRMGELLRTAKRVARGLHGSDAEAYVALTQVGSLEKTAPLVRVRADQQRFTVPILRTFEQAGGSQLRRHLVTDMSHSLPNDMLVKVDRASMAMHLEARVPFLDHRLAEMGLGLPQRFTLGKDGKEVLRELYARRFGRTLARRKKQGFGVPVEKWL
ncbi:MAG TPA: asparagine synthase (glutamine-hydrolyzing), partial [Polyangiaceae bacterium]